jgi:hypothetical protein
VDVKKSGKVTKFKVRCSKYLYTYVVADADKVDKLRQSLPPGTPVFRSGLAFACCCYCSRVLAANLRCVNLLVQA